MTTALLAGVLRHLRRIAPPRTDLTDAELIEEFVRCRDEAAFEALMRRHGPMVWGVCRRALRHEADAEDAFQATFLVLVRKAAALADRAAVGNFLYGVAHNVARKLRAMNDRRRDREHLWATARPSETVVDAWQHLRPLLDEELSRLPDKYRSAVVLCDLEGRSVGEAARLLGCPLGTVGSRLARGRQLLGRRLARQGLTLSVGTIGLLLSRHAAEAGAPASLRPATARTAALVKGVLNGMLMTRIKTIAVLVLAICGLGLGFLPTGGEGGSALLQPTVQAAPLPHKPTLTPLQVLKEAREAAFGIEDKQQKAGILRNIAKAQAQAGDKATATQTFQEALKVSVPEQVALWSLAEAQAEAGDIEGARETAAAIGDQNQRDDALALIAGAQARAGDFEGARRAAEELSAKPRAYALAQSRLALAFAAAGKAEEAVRATAAMNDFERVTILTHVAGALAKAKVLEGAANSLAEAAKIAVNLPDGGDQRSIAYVAFAEGQAELGDVKEALRSVEFIPMESWKEPALSKIACVQARAGDVKGALRTADAIKKRDDLKRETLAWIIQAQLRSGDVNGARQTADSLKGNIYHAWCQARIAAAEAKPADRVPAAAAAFDKAVAEQDEGAKGDNAKRLPDFVNRDQLQCAMALEQSKAGEAWEAYEWASGQKDPWLKAQALFNVAWGMAQRGAVLGKQSTP